jgi:AcrR family transcriptional regulator
MARAGANSKRERLEVAAAELFHKAGVERTSLADVAAAAEVPLGSVYFYFRTKDDLAAAVIKRRESWLGRLLDRHGTIPDPRKRLEALVDVWVDDREIDARYGCPVGSLCFEIARARGAVSTHAARPFRVLLDWCGEQFRELGAGKAADGHALHLIAALQGISLTASVLNDPGLIVKEAKHLKAWLRDL